MKKVGRLFCLFAFLFVFTITCTGLSEAADESKPVNSITLDATEISIGKGTKVQATATVEPENADNAKVKWSSKDQKIAKVTNNGSILGVGIGSTTIVCEAADGHGASAEIQVTVFQPVQGLKTAQTRMDAFIGKTQPGLEVIVNPANATYKVISWSSEDESIATVDENGRVTGIAEGTVKIIATVDEASSMGGQSKSAFCTVKVTRGVESISLDVTDLKIAKGSNGKVTASVAPETAANKKVKWSSADPKIAQVSNAGMISGRGIGTTTITCTAEDGSGAEATLNVTVFQPVQSIKMDNPKMNAFVGKTTKAQVSIVPSDAEYQDIIWTSSDESVATVNENGEITGIKGGNVVITATSAEPVSGNKPPKSATCKVQVVQAVEYIGLEKNEDKSTNKKLALKLTVLPETATNKKVVWTTSNKKVATVKNGVVTIKKREGEAVITATAADGSEIYASCRVTVGFSGVIMSIGSYEYREGVYTWDVDSFTGNGTI